VCAVARRQEKGYELTKGGGGGTVDRRREIEGVVERSNGMKMAKVKPGMG